MADIERELAISSIGEHTEVIGVEALRLLREKAAALDFLMRMAVEGGRIVSSGDLTTFQIAEAQACKRFFVGPGGGLGWAILPWELTTHNDRNREQEYFANKMK